MYGFPETPEHKFGIKVVELAERAGRKGEAYCAAMLPLPDGRECYVKAYKPSTPRKPDPSAP